PEDEENPGAGFFRRASFGFSPDTRTQLGVTYNHRDPTDARHQLSQVADHTEFTAQDGSKTNSLTNIEVEQIGLDNPQDPLNLQKTVRPPARAPTLRDSRTCCSTAAAFVKMRISLAAKW